jgi:biotin carboxyl carrier protein
MTVGLGPSKTAWAIAQGATRWVFIDGVVYVIEDRPPAPKRRSGHHESLTAPMPATVIRIQSKPGDAVRKGDVLVVLEAMKMELPVRAPADGRVEAVNCREGDLVQPGQPLIELED